MPPFFGVGDGLGNLVYIPDKNVFTSFLTFQDAFYNANSQIIYSSEFFNQNNSGSAGFYDMKDSKIYKNVKIQPDTTKNISYPSVYNLEILAKIKEDENITIYKICTYPENSIVTYFN